MYKNKFLESISRVLSESEQGVLDEAAFPAYAHSNPLISFLFWRRLFVIMNYLEKKSPFKSVLDFGTGSGVMLPFLSGIANKVEALDVDLKPVKSISSYLPFPDNISFTQYSENNFDVYPEASFDLIVALDVLEHIQDLDKTLKWLFGLLKPEGQIVFSGPTENLVYKIGRKIAGRQFTGSYHTADILDVKRTFQSFTTVKTIATLYPVVTFFSFYSVTRPND